MHTHYMHIVCQSTRSAGGKAQFVRFSPLFPLRTLTKIIILCIFSLFSSYFLNLFMEDSQPFVRTSSINYQKDLYESFK